MICDARDKLGSAPSKTALSDIKEAESLLVARFDPIARKFAYRRAAGRLDVDDIVQGFWLKVLDKSLLARYEGRGNASLRTFLLGVLHHHIQDEFRALGRKRTPAACSLDQSDSTPEPDQMPAEAESDQLGWVERKEPAEPSAKDLEDLPGAVRPQDEIEKAQLQHLASHLVGKALDLLSVCFPKDALLIRLHMDGVANTEIINENLLDEPYLNRDALKKRSSRARKRFGIILARLCPEEDLSIQDLIENFRGFRSYDIGGQSSDS